MSDLTWTAGDAAGENIAGSDSYYVARNTNASAAVADLKLEIMSSIGAYTMAGDSFPFLRTKQELYRDHIKNCVYDYPDLITWQKQCGCLLIHESDFIRGLASSGSAYPLQINCEVRFENRREFRDGTIVRAGSQPGVAHDLIAGTPLMLMIYDKQLLTMQAASAIASSMNVSHATAQSVIQRT